MTTQNIGLFKGMNAKMDYLNQRQRVVSQNIANADTPGYKPRDLVDVDFSKAMEKALRTSNKKHVSIQTTNEGHMPPPDSIRDARSKDQRKTYEIAPAGNAVIMEEQLIKSNETIMDYNLITSLYQKNIGMIKTSIGRGQ